GRRGRRAKSGSRRSPALGIGEGEGRRARDAWSVADGCRRATRPGDRCARGRPRGQARPRHGARWRPRHERGLQGHGRRLTMSARVVSAASPLFRVERASRLAERAWAPVDASSLGVFRILLGALVAIAAVRHWYKGAIFDAFIVPTHFFPYDGLSFVK